jgi:hypothetical protein
MFLNLDLLPSSGEERETPTLLGRLTLLKSSRLALSKGPNRLGDSFPSHVGGNWSSFRNVAFSTYLEFRAVDKVHKPSDSEL